MDDAVVPACDTPLWAAAGRSVVTVEGLAPDGGLHPVQQALLDHQAAQCGFCISGIAVRAAALLEEIPAPDAETVALALDRNLCRCGAQRRIIGAVVAAGQAMAARGEPCPASPPTPGHASPRRRLRPAPRCPRTSRPT